jgi:hypothetical protein
MPKRDKAEEALDRAVALRDEPDVATLVAGLKELIAGKLAIAVAKAAAVATKREVADRLAAECNAAFDWFLDHADPGCSAKTALVETGTIEVDRLLIAIRHVQMEGSYGPPIDVAAAMRGHAALALLNARYPDALREIVPLLDDADQRGVPTDARRGAIRALGTVIGETSAIMLRMTARRFAHDPETLSEVFTSLISIEPARSLEFLATFLDTGDTAVVDTAALSIASARQPTSLDVLLNGWRKRSLRSDDAQAYLTAIAMTRRPAAIDALLAEVEHGSQSRAIEALAALELFQSDAAICARVRAVVIRRHERAVKDAATAFTS